MLRKSPYQHQVKSHTRQGKTIATYERGKGNKPRIRSRPKKVVGGDKKIPRTFTGKDNYAVTLFYGGFDSEAFDIDTDSYMSAMRGGFTRTPKTESPEKVKIRSVQ